MFCSIHVTFIGTASKRERIYLKLFMLRIISHIMLAKQPTIPLSPLYIKKIPLYLFFFNHLLYVP